MDRMIDLLYNFLSSVPRLTTDAWNICVKQHYIEGYTNIGTGILMGILIIGGAFLLRWLLKQPDSIDNDLPIMILSILLCVLALVSLICIHDGVLKIINPQYYALKDLLGGKF